MQSKNQHKKHISGIIVSVMLVITSFYFFVVTLYEQFKLGGVSAAFYLTTTGLVGLIFLCIGVVILSKAIFNKKLATNIDEKIKFQQKRKLLYTVLGTISSIILTYIGYFSIINAKNELYNKGAGAGFSLYIIVLIGLVPLISGLVIGIFTLVVNLMTRKK